MAAHSPGPWHWKPGNTENHDMPQLVAADGSIVCHFGNDTEYYPNEGQPPQESDARLIGLAPDFLAACRAALAYDRAILEVSSRGRQWVESDGSNNLDRLYDTWIDAARVAVTSFDGSPSLPPKDASPTDSPLTLNKARIRAGVPPIPDSVPGDPAGDVPR